MTKKKVLVFSEDVLAMSETFIADHCRYLKKYTPILTGLSRRKDGLNCDDLNIKIVDIVDNKINRFLFRVGRLSAFDDLICEVKPDLIHAHYATNGAFLLSYARKHNIPLVTTVHGFDVTRIPSKKRLYGLLYSLKLTELKRSNTTLLAVSNYLKNKSLQLGFNDESVLVHYLGISIRNSSMIDLKCNDLRIVFVGRLVEKKGLDILLDAFKILQKKIPSVKLDIVGDGALSPLVLQAVNKNHGITWHGALNHEKVFDVMKTGRVFCLPSRTARDGDSEGLGLVLLEAQSLGLPVVTSNESGTSEAVRDGITGFAVDTTSFVAVATALEKILGDVELNYSMGLNAFNWIRDCFDIAKQSINLENIYDSLVD